MGRTPPQVIDSVQYRTISYDQLSWELPDHLGELDPEELSNQIIAVNEEYVSNRDDYLTVFSYNDMANPAKDSDPVPWIAAFQQVFNRTLRDKFDWISAQQRPANIILYAPLALDQVQLLQFPQKLIISNNIDLAIEIHHREFREHFAKDLEKPVIVHLENDIKFQYAVHRAWMECKLDMLDYLQFLEQTTPS